MILNLDCRQGLAMLPDNSIDAILTDPPYELGFMGHAWDRSGIAYDVAMWREALRVLKPGGHLLAFSGSRTYHRMTCAIEDAGFDVRDQMLWVYSQGFPKSLDISKAIDKAAGAVQAKVRYAPRAETSGTLSGSTESRPWIEKSRELGYHEVDGDIPITLAAEIWQGWGTALKPAHEPICVARKPLSESTVAANVLAHGVGGINIDGCRVAIDPEADASQLRTMNVAQHDGADGWGMNTSAANPAARVLGAEGRWPANLIHDGSPEVVAMFPDTKSGYSDGTKSGIQNVAFGKYGAGTFAPTYGDSGSAARFFQRCEWEQGDLEAALLYYCAKASKREKGEDNKHPTVKPIALGRYLSRLICPPGGTILDLFAGSGSFPVAAKLEGFTPIGFELDEGHCEYANRRLYEA